MAHCCHCSPTEFNLLKQKEVGIIHCPNSNLSLGSGLLNVRKLLDEGHEKLGLGTDVSGGYATSILDSFRSAFATSKIFSIFDQNSKILSISELFSLLTLNGAKALNLGENLGNFKKGKNFDALLINSSTKKGKIDRFPHDSIESMFEKFLFLGDDRNIFDVFVDGVRVAGNR